MSALKLGWFAFAVILATNVEAGDPVRPLLPGDHAAPLRAFPLLQKGDPEPAPAAGGRAIKVLVFFGSWDPLSRSVMPVEDRRLTELRARGVRYMAIAEEAAEDAEAYLRRAGVIHLPVVCDPSGDILRETLGTDTGTPCPFAVITEQASPGAAARVLWLGPVVNDPDSWARFSGYVDDLPSALSRILSGGFKPAAARVLEIKRRALYELVADAQVRAYAGHPEQALPIAKKLLAARWPAAFVPMRRDSFTTLAYFLADAAHPSAEQTALALDLAKSALASAREPDAVLLHVYARALSASGDIKGAREAQNRAVRAPRPRGQSLQMWSAGEHHLHEALRRYEQAAGAKPGAVDITTAAPDTLPSADALADLDDLARTMRLYHPAFDDVAWRLAGAGSSWEAHTRQTAESLRAKPEWALEEFANVIRSYLSIVYDGHTVLRCQRRDKDGLRDQRFMPPTEFLGPFFADVRVRKSGDSLVVIETLPGLGITAGAEITGVPVIGRPASVEAGRPYLLPTLPGAVGGAPEYLLGLLANVLAKPPESVTVGIRAGSQAQQVTLPVHRGRCAIMPGKGQPAWKLEREPLPVLVVRSMVPSDLDGMVATADTLRAAPVVVLDVRANGGGSDTPGMEWSARLSGRLIRCFRGFGYFRAGETDAARRWNTFFGDNWMARTGEAPAVSGKPFAGRLFVLMDKFSGSAAEGFAAAAGMIPGARLVGENSSGIAMYGNQSQQWMLPHSHIQVRFGWSKGVVAGRSSRDGLGLLPDYWLDTADPVKAIAAHVNDK